MRMFKPKKSLLTDSQRKVCDSANDFIVKKLDMVVAGSSNDESALLAAGLMIKTILTYPVQEVEKLTWRLYPEAELKIYRDIFQTINKLVMNELPGHVFNQNIFDPRLFDYKTPEQKVKAQEEVADIYKKIVEGWLQQKYTDGTFDEVDILEQEEYFQSESILSGSY